MLFACDDMGKMRPTEENEFGIHTQPTRMRKWGQSLNKVFVP